MLRAACSRVVALADAAPAAWASTVPEATLRRLLTWAFEKCYSQTPEMASMRADGGACECYLRPPHSHSTGNILALTVVAADGFERTYHERPVPGTSFGLAVVFCDETGEALASAATVLPAGERLHMPPPLTYMPNLDPLCNVLYHIVDRTPLEAFGGSSENRAAFRTALFEVVLPQVYSAANAVHRESGRGFHVMPPSPAGSLEVRFVPAEDELPREELRVFYQNIVPGETFPLFFDFLDGVGDGFRDGDITQMALPCMDAWPTAWVLAWLAERPGSDACRRCGVTGAPTKRCTACRSVRYCSKGCQTADWRRHKNECALLDRSPDSSFPRV